MLSLTVIILLVEIILLLLSFGIIDCYKVVQDNQKEQ